MLNMLRTSKRVDAVMTGVSAVKARQVWQAAKTITRIRHSQIMYVATISEEVWQSLSAAQRGMISDAAQQAENEHWAQIVSIEEANYRFAEDQGMDIIDISSDDLVDWRVCSSDMLENFLRRVGGDAQALMTAYGRTKAALSQ